MMDFYQSVSKKCVLTRSYFPNLCLINFCFTNLQVVGKKRNLDKYALFSRTDESRSEFHDPSSVESEATQIVVVTVG